jgi:signal transduction histidine kinase
MKNISSYEMDFDVNEIFERFKRGDKSRSTEGSGLGLTIAKSIVELEGGKFDIEIDGDLFKAILTFPTR